MAERVNLDDFTNRSYEQLPLSRILEAYKTQTAEVTPDLVLSRFQNLEGYLDKMGLELITLARNNQTARIEERAELANDAQIAYAKELEFVYSERIVNEKFAWKRLMNPGRSPRLSEAKLIAQYGTIPMDRLFDSEFLSVYERVTLAGELDKDGKHLVEINFLNARVKKIKERMEELVNEIANAQSLGEQGQPFRDKLDVQLHELDDERKALYELSIERTATGPDKNI